MDANLGTRSVVEPALAHGQLDIEPDYAGTLLLFLNAKDTAAADQLSTAVPDLKRLLAPSGANRPQPGSGHRHQRVRRDQGDGQEGPPDHGLESQEVRLEVRAGRASQCPTRPTCLPGLEHVYGLHFLSFKSLDEAGPISVAALKQGEVQVVELFSSDGSVVQNGFVALTDNKHLQPADHVIPVVRKSVNTPQVAAALNKVSAKLTTDQLSKLNIEVDDQNESPATVAQQWVTSEGLT